MEPKHFPPTSAAGQRGLRLLVPLDGSKPAERALEAAAYLASVSNSRILLLHALERKPPARVHGEHHLAAAEEAEQYLNGMAERLRAQGIETAVHVHPGGVRDVAESILEHAAEIDPDLIVLATHGRGGFRHMVFGTIAQAVLGQSRWPILLVPAAEESPSKPFSLTRVLMPVDVRHLHDEMLARMASLAKAFHAEAHLLFVVPTAETLAPEQSAVHRLLPATGRALLEFEARESQAFVTGIAERWRTSGVQIETKVLRGDPVEEVIEYADSIDADLIAVATHGRAGLFARLEGNTISRLISRVRRPLLLLRTPGSSTST